jgi:hypothetical protein
VFLQRCSGVITAVFWFSYSGVLVFLQRCSDVLTAVFLCSYSGVLGFLQRCSDVLTAVFLCSHSGVLVFLQPCSQDSSLLGRSVALPGGSQPCYVTAPSVDIHDQAVQEEGQVGGGVRKAIRNRRKTTEIRIRIGLIT